MLGSNYYCDLCVSIDEDNEEKIRSTNAKKCLSVSGSCVSESYSLGCFSFTNSSECYGTLLI